MASQSPRELFPSSNVISHHVSHGIRLPLLSRWCVNLRSLTPPPLQSRARAVAVATPWREEALHSSHVIVATYRKSKRAI